MGRIKKKSALDLHPRRNRKHSVEVNIIACRVYLLHIIQHFQKEAIDLDFTIHAIFQIRNTQPLLH